MQIGPYKLKNNVFLAPMAGITDRPFRQMCQEWDAGLTVSEMVSSKPELRYAKRTQLKSDRSGEFQPRAVQIVGSNPTHMADAARYNVDRGAQIIDINMGCPAKKVCNVAAGSALMKDEGLVTKILEAVVNAVNVPVTLKIRTGWDRIYRNAVSIAKIAESSGIQAIAIHGRTRACRFKGLIDYETIRNLKRNINIPVIANGDIDSPEKAKWVLDVTAADGVMVGRAAQGRPWIFRSIAFFLEHGKHFPDPDKMRIHDIIVRHLSGLYELYGSAVGVRVARKHLDWYFKQIPTLNCNVPRCLFTAESPDHQLRMVDSIFD